MRYVILLLPVMVMIASCSSPNAKKDSTDTVIAGDTLARSASTPNTNNTPTISNICFIRTEGNNGLDSTVVQLVIKGNTVTGEMNWLPYQKDGRKGILNGTILNDTIKAVWTFKQEGRTDTMAVNYLLKDNKLSQKPLRVNDKTGRQQTDNTADYTVKYSPYGGKM